MVLHGLDYKVLAVVILLQQRLTVNLNINDIIQGQILLKNLVDEIILTEQGKSNVFHEGG